MHALRDNVIAASWLWPFGNDIQALWSPWKIYSCRGFVNVQTASLKPLLDGAGVSQTQAPTTKSNKYVAICIEAHSAEREESTFSIFYYISVIYAMDKRNTLLWSSTFTQHTGSSHMTLCVNHMTLPTVRCRYLKKSVRLISPEGLRVKNPNLIHTLWHKKILPFPHGSLVTREIYIPGLI